MSYTLTRGSILDSTADVLVNPTNCAGPMGKGLAAAYKLKYPGLETWYKKQIEGFQPGDVHFYDPCDGQLIASLATKNHWKNPSKLEWIERGVHRLRDVCEDLSGDPVIDELPIHTVAVPPLGAGLGGLNKFDVLELMVDVFDTSPITFYLYNFED